MESIYYAVSFIFVFFSIVTFGAVWLYESKEQ